MQIILLSAMKMKKVPKCSVPCGLSNITVYSDVADVVCDEEAHNIDEHIDRVPHKRHFR